MGIIYELFDNAKGELQLSQTPFSKHERQL